MELMGQIAQQRLELMMEAEHIFEQTTQILTSTTCQSIKKSLQQLKQLERTIQHHENQNLLGIQLKRGFSRAELLRFQQIMHEYIFKLCPDMIMSEIRMYQIDGRHRNICLLFMTFFLHLQWSEKANEIQSIYVNKSYDVITFTYLTTKWFCLASRKLVMMRFKQYDEKINKFEYQMNNEFIIRKPNNNNRPSLLTTSFYGIINNERDRIMNISQSSLQEIPQKRKLFKQFNRLIRQVIWDAEIEEIIPNLQVATFKYRSLLFRNLQINNTIEAYLIERKQIPQKLSINFQFEHYQRRISVRAEASNRIPNRILPKVLFSTDFEYQEPNRMSTVTSIIQKTSSSHLYRKRFQSHKSIETDDDKPSSPLTPLKSYFPGLTNQTSNKQIQPHIDPFTSLMIIYEKNYNKDKQDYKKGFRAGQTQGRFKQKQDLIRIIMDEKQQDTHQVQKFNGKF